MGDCQYALAMTTQQAAVLTGSLSSCIPWHCEIKGVWFSIFIKTEADGITSQYLMR